MAYGKEIILKFQNKGKMREINCQYFYNVDKHKPENVNSLFKGDVEVYAGQLGAYMGNRLLGGY